MQLRGGVATQGAGDSYTITFDSNGHGEAPGNIVVEYGSTATAPTAPSAIGWTFNEWYSGQDAFDWNTKIKQDYTLVAQWTENKYTIEFDANAPDGATKAGSTYSLTEINYTNEEVTLTENGFTVEGYRFNGWTTDQSGTGTKIADKDTVSMADLVGTEEPENSKVTLYATWVKTNTITFNMKDHGDAVAPATYDAGQQADAPDAPSAEGYTFGGWYTSEDGGTTLADTAYDFETVLESDITLYAKWTANKYTISFDGNKPAGATGAVTMDEKAFADVEAAYDEEKTLPTAAPELTGYAFKGWNVAAEPEEDAQNYGAGTKVSNLAATDDANVTLFAQWEIDKFDVTFDTDGHGTVPSQSVEYGKTVEKPADPTAAGYDFKGWYIKTDDKLSDEAYDFTTAVNGNLVLAAKWEAKSSTVTFELNGHGDAIESQSVEYGKLATEPTAPAATGYAFGGWYADEALGSTFNFNDPIQRDTTVYAKWTANTYTIAFSNVAPEGATDTVGMGDITSVTATYDNDAKLPEAEPTLAGYTFRGWVFKDSDDKETVYQAGAPVKNLTAENNDTVTLTPKWEINKYTVTFNSKPDDGILGLEGAPENQTVDHGKTATKPNDPTATNMIFKGWFEVLVNEETNEPELAETAFSFDAAITKNVTLQAKWETKTFAVTYVTDYKLAGDESFNPTNPSAAPARGTVDYGKEATAPTDAPTAENAVFEGWYLGAADAESDKVTLADEYGFNAPVTADVTVYAKWAEAATVKFVNGESELSSSLVAKGTVPAAPADEPEKESTNTVNYEFAGWQTGEGEAASKYPKGASLPEVTGAVTYTAYYAESVRTYTIEWKDGDGNVLKTYIQEFGTDIEEPAGLSPVKAETDQYKFTFADKWTDGANEVANGEFGKVSKDVAYTAVFKEELKSYKVTFVTNDGVEAPAAETVKYGAYVGKPALTLEDDSDYNFDEKWYKDADLTEEFDFATKVSGELTLYAGLTIKPSVQAANDIKAAEEAQAAAEAAKAAANEAAKKAEATGTAADAEAAAKAAEEYRAAAEAAKAAADQAVESAKVEGSGVDPADVAKLEDAAKAAADAATAASDAAKAAQTNATAKADAEKKAAEANANLSSAKITVAGATYTGKALTPAVTVVDSNGKTLKSGADYTVAYKNNTNAGTATATVTGKGTYTGSKSANFTIAKAKNTITAKAKKKTLAAKAKKKTAIKAGKAFKVTKAQGKVTYKKKSGNKKITVASNGKITVKKGLKKGKTANVKQFFPLRGKHFFLHLGKIVFPRFGKHIYPADGKEFFPGTVSGFFYPAA